MLLALLAGILLFIVLFVVVSSFVEEPLRRSMERTMNEKLADYTVRIGALDLNLRGFAVELEDMLVAQNELRDPPIARIARLRVSVDWKELIGGLVVADCLIDTPKLHINLSNVQQEQKDQVPVDEKGWQDALESIYPLTINKLEIREGDLTYVDKGDFRPLHLTDWWLEARNIRNLRAQEDTYPSEVRTRSVVFGTGAMRFDGRANFMAKPHPGLQGDLELKQIDLSFFQPLVARIHLAVRKGVLTSGTSRLEYAPWKRELLVSSLRLEGLEGDYLHGKRNAERDEEQQSGQEPEFLFHIREMHLDHGNLGVRNLTQDPPYRIFVSEAEAEIGNLSTGFSRGPIQVRLRGRFMGSGKAAFNGSFRPESRGPDFAVQLAVRNTNLTLMNSVLRAHADLDVTRGNLSLYSEITVKNGAIQGYVKPLLQEVNVYSIPQEQEDSLFQQIYEGVVGAIAGLLKNAPREEIATRVDLSGNLEDPEISTMEVVMLLIQNAFFKAILPGLERDT